MEIVVDIPEDDYNRIVKEGMTVFGSDADIALLERSLEKGTVLPKGHGRLIDADILLSKAKLIYKGYEIALTNTIGDATTIIEADKEE